MLRSIIKWFSKEKESPQEALLMPKEPSERWEVKANSISPDFFEELKPAVDYFDSKIKKLTHELHRWVQDLEQGQGSQKDIVSSVIPLKESLRLDLKNAQDNIEYIDKHIIHTHLYESGNFPSSHDIFYWNLFIKGKKEKLHSLQEKFTHPSKALRGVQKSKSVAEIPDKEDLNSSLPSVFTIQKKNAISHRVGKM